MINFGLFCMQIYKNVVLMPLFMIRKVPKLNYNVLVNDILFIEIRLL